MQFMKNWKGKVIRVERAPFDAAMNRWTGKPHEHKRESARRNRQREARNGN